MNSQDIRETVKTGYAGRPAGQIRTPLLLRNGTLARRIGPHHLRSVRSERHGRRALRSRRYIVVVRASGGAAQLRPGETVLDLGSGGRIDVLLSAKRVGPTGTVYGLNLTDEMVAHARENQHRAGLKNVELPQGRDQAHIPHPHSLVDTMICNGVINLSDDKARMFSEAFRFLKPGDRLPISALVVRGTRPADIRKRMQVWAGCVAGPLEESECRTNLEQAGFVGPSSKPTRMHHVEGAKQLLSGSGIDADAIAPFVDGAFMSAFVRLTKPPISVKEWTQQWNLRFQSSDRLSND